MKGIHSSGTDVALEVTMHNRTPEGEPRDVYYIILDRYAGLHTLGLLRGEWLLLLHAGTEAVAATLPS